MNDIHEMSIMPAQYLLAFLVLRLGGSTALAAKATGLFSAAPLPHSFQ